MRYLLDINIVSAWARKTSSVLMLKLPQTPPAALCVCTLVEHELLYGFELTSGTRAAEEEGGPEIRCASPLPHTPRIG